MNWKEIKEMFMPKGIARETERIVYIDFLKVVAAFLTVFYHYAYYKLDYGFDTSQACYFPNISRIVMCFSACCVPVFFLVNGALLFRKRRPLKNIYRKAVKIFALTAVWALTDFPSWFFKTLVILYILFPLFQYLYEKRIKFYYATIFALLIFPFGYNAAILLVKLLFQSKMVCIIGRMINVEQLSVTGFFTMYSIVYFLLGPILARASIRTIHGMVAMVGGIGMVVFECVSYTVMNGAMYDGVNAAFPTYGALLLSAGVFIVAKNTVRNGSKMVGLMRDQILAIYVLHMAVAHIIGRVLVESTISLPTAIAGTLLILFICIGVGKIASHIPVLCWFFRI